MAGDSGVQAPTVALRGAGRIQRRIWRCFMTHPENEFTTADLAAWCYPRWGGLPTRHQRRAIVRAALRVAERVRRDRPGGVVFRAFGSKAVAKPNSNETFSAPNQ